MNLLTVMPFPAEIKVKDRIKLIPENSVIIMCGLPATGKSTVAKKIAKIKKLSLLSSDVIRLEVIKEDIFDKKIASDMDKRFMVYEVMFNRAKKITETGKGVILDATFVTQQLRKKAASIAYQQKIPFCIIETRCSQQTAIKRIKNRSKKNYESNAITEEAYFNNVRIFETVDIKDIRDSFPGMEVLHIVINTEQNE